MMRWVGIASLIGIAAVWVAFGMSLWLVVGPWKLTTHLLKRVSP